MENLFFFLNNIVSAIWFFILGASLGSFANVCARRIPAGISIISPRSRCTNCKTPIRAYYNIPILSWIFLKGRCAYCKGDISVEYPVVEFLCAVLVLLLYREFGATYDLFFYTALCIALVVITLIDIRHMIIPDVITLPGIVAGVVFNAFRTDWREATEAVFSSGMVSFPQAADIAIFNSIGGILLGGGTFLLIAMVYRAIRKKEGMGMGDVKLVSMLGAFFGMWGVLVVIFLSSILGTLIGLLVIILRKKDPGYAIAYGPFLSLAAILYLLGNDLLLVAGINIGLFG